MKVVILAGGLGTRLLEETGVRPKPMVEIGGMPILWHIMRLYARQGFEDFTVALGYKGDYVKDFFLNYRLLTSDLSVDMARGAVEWQAGGEDDWQVELCDTGHDTLTGGRLLRLAPRLREHGTFMATYGDGLSDVNLRALLAFHRAHGQLATLTAVRPPQPERRLALADDRVLGYQQAASEDCVNGGFFVFEPEVLDYIDGDGDTLEAGALTRLARAGQLMAFEHAGFWQCMDTPQERDYLEQLWRSKKAPWVCETAETDRAETRSTAQIRHATAGTRR